MSDPKLTVHPSSPLQPNVLIKGRYQIIQTDLGAGFEGWHNGLAQDLDLPQAPLCWVWCAIVGSAGADRLIRQASILGQIDHAQVPKLLAAPEIDGYQYLITRHHEGQSLAEMIGEGQRWDESRLIPLLVSLLSVLAAVHQQGIVHGNLHPGCLIQAQAAEDWILTGFGAEQGTCGYIAPERGQGYPCAASDLYSLGMVAVQLLFGDQPMDLQRQAQARQLDWSQVGDSSSPVTQVIRDMVAFDPSDRPTHAEIFQAISPTSERVPPPAKRLSQGRRQLKASGQGAKKLAVGSTAPVAQPAAATQNLALGEADRERACTQGVKPPEAQAMPASQPEVRASQPEEPMNSGNVAQLEGGQWLKTRFGLDRPVSATPAPLSNLVQIRPEGTTSPVKKSPNPPQWVMRGGIAGVGVASLLTIGLGHVGSTGVQPPELAQLGTEATDFLSQQQVRTTTSETPADQRIPLGEASAGTSRSVGMPTVASSGRSRPASPVRMSATAQPIATTNAQPDSEGATPDAHRDEPANSPDMNASAPNSPNQNDLLAVQASPTASGQAASGQAGTSVRDAFTAYYDTFEAENPSGAAVEKPALWADEEPVTIVAAKTNKPADAAKLSDPTQDSALQVASAHDLQAGTVTPDLPTDASDEVPIADISTHAMTHDLNLADEPGFEEVPPLNPPLEAPVETADLADLEPEPAPQQVIFSPDQQWMVSLNEADRLKIWNLQTGSETPIEVALDTEIVFIEVALDGAKVIGHSASGDQFVVLDLNTLPPV